MKKVIVALVLCVAVLAMTAGYVLAAAKKIDLKPFLDNYPGLTGGGFVIFNDSSSVNNLHVIVSLKKADTSRLGNELDVWLFVDFSGGVVGTMTLNKMGNGNFYYNTSVTPGMSHKLYIVLTEKGLGDDAYNTVTHIDKAFK